MLDGITISGFRSFGEPALRISDFSQVNIVIGKNNCGKSNLLRFIHLLGRHAHSRKTKTPLPTFDRDIDFTIGRTPNSITYEIQLRADGFTEPQFQEIRTTLLELSPIIFQEPDSHLWMEFNLSRPHEPTQASISNFAELLHKSWTPQIKDSITSRLLHYTRGDSQKSAIEVSKRIHQEALLPLNVQFIDAFRQITNTDGDPLSGAGLIKSLRTLQNPELSTYNSGKSRFLKILRFLRDLLGEPEANLEIPAAQDEILVTLNSKVLPLASLGTGIHELIILAAAVTLNDDSIFCIEEPEIHLHPKLQKKFIHYRAHPKTSRTVWR